jgi:hypothetical protein
MAAVFRGRIQPSAVVVLVGISLLLGCASQPVLLRSASILNASGGDIQNVRVRHDPTRRMGMVSAILQGSSFDLGFDGEPLLGERAVVTWTDRNGQRQSCTLAIPKGSSTEQETKKLIYRIGESGHVSVHLVR